MSIGFLNQTNGLELGETGLLSVRQFVQPMVLAVFVAAALVLTIDHYYAAELRAAASLDDEVRGALTRYLSNPFCLGILAVFLAAACYATLQAVGLRVDTLHLRLLVDANDPPGWHGLACRLSGRAPLTMDGLFRAALRWGASAREDQIAALGDHLLLARESQYQQNLGPLHFAVWVLPLLGFIGTVIGITAAIGGLKDVVVSPSGIAPTSGGGLAGVLAGLQYAFDTTFMGLVLVIPTMLMMLGLRARAQVVAMLFHEAMLDAQYGADSAYRSAHGSS